MVDLQTENERLRRALDALRYPDKGRAYCKEEGLEYRPGGTWLRQPWQDDIIDHALGRLDELEAALRRALYADPQSQYELLKAVHEQYSVDIDVQRTLGGADIINAYRGSGSMPIASVQGLDLADSEDA